VQDQPVVGVPAEGLGNDLLELRFDDVDILARGEAGAIADAKYVSVDGEGFRPEVSVENNVGGLAADARKFTQYFTIPGDLGAEAVDQRLRERDHILGLGIEQTDRFDRVFERFFAQFDHLFGRFDAFEELARRDIDPGVRRLRRQHDGDQQLVDVAVLKLRGGRRVGLGQAAEEFENLGAVHRLPTTSRIE
jgi:hypothetical protein